MGGKRLGTVESVADDAFSVVVNGSSVWLKNTVLFTANAGKVRLVCEQRGLEAYILASAQAHAS
jgi:hypothetical protein